MNKTQMTPLQTALDEIKKRLEAATPDKWRADIWRSSINEPRLTEAKIIAGGVISFQSVTSGERAALDAELIAAAPTDIAKLLEVVKLYDETLGLVDGRYRYRDVNDEDCEGDYCLEARAKAAKILGEGERVMRDFK